MLSQTEHFSCNMILILKDHFSRTQTPYMFKITEHVISYLNFLKSPKNITMLYKTEFKKWEIAGIEPSPFSSEGHA